MRSLRRLLTRLANSAAKRQDSQRLREEIEQHVTLQTAENIKAGMPPAEARRQALLKFGAIESVKEDYRAERGFLFFDTLLQDIRYGVRMLLKSWKPASIATFSLAVAMALSVAALSVFNGLMLRPPVATAPERLVTIYTVAPGNEFHNISYPDYEYYRDNNHSFSGMAAFPEFIGLLPMTVGGLDKMGTVEQASDNYFQVMGIRPFMGRLFTPGDDEKNVSEAILTYSAWKRWGADPKIVGKTVVLSRQRKAVTIVGVAQKNFTGVFFGFSADVITTLPTNSQAFTQHNLWLFLIGRLKPGVTRESAGRFAVQRRFRGSVAELLQTIEAGGIAARRGAIMLARWGVATD